MLSGICHPTSQNGDLALDFYRYARAIDHGVPPQPALDRLLHERIVSRTGQHQFQLVIDRPRTGSGVLDDIPDQLSLEWLRPTPDHDLTSLLVDGQVSRVEAGIVLQSGAQLPCGDTSAAPMGFDPRWLNAQLSCAAAATSSTSGDWP